MAGEIAVSDHHITTLEVPGPFRAPKITAISWILIAVGIGTFVILLLGDAHSKERAWSSLLQGMMIPTLISIAALWYVAVHSVVNAKWTIPLRRIMEGLTSGIAIGALAFCALALFGAEYLYDWIYASGNPDLHRSLFHVHGGSKEALMTKSRWIISTLVIFGMWLIFRWRLTSFSIQQDTTGADIRRPHLKWSIAYVIFFALSLTFFVWDMLLSLHLSWFSTMWGVYCFASAVQTFLCVLVLFMVWLRRGPMKQHLQEHTVHDVGTWMVAWSCFCAYIGFSQYMLIWYANMDEETLFYVIRTQHGYGFAYSAEALLRWPLPFLGLMSQSVRTKSWALTIIAIAVLVGNWMDWSWIIMPAFSLNHYRPFWSLPEVLIGAGFAGAFLIAVTSFWSRNGLIPKGEPRLLSTINAEHLH
jgi:hypothetical protein